MATLIAEDVFEIDTLLGGWERVTSGYLVDGPEPVLVETGSQSSVPALLAALDDLGIAAEDLAHVVVTHIHLDHAGGVGDVAQAFPQATVHVHEKGARHLVDPTRLVDSAAMVYGDLLDSLYGRLTPTEAARVNVLEDGDELVVGPGRVLTTIDSPGHAKHHLGLHDSLSGLLFVGDAVGVRLPDAGILRPATPPPDFDLDQALTSIAKFAARRPTGIALAHYGLVPGGRGRPGRGLRDPDPLGRGRRGRLAAGRRHRRGARHRVRRGPGRRRPRPQAEAGDPERDPLQRRRFPPLARQAGRHHGHHHHPGPWALRPLLPVQQLTEAGRRPERGSSS